jgi:hypothetical protein
MAGQHAKDDPKTAWLYAWFPVFSRPSARFRNWCRGRDQPLHNRCAAKFPRCIEETLSTVKLRLIRRRWQMECPSMWLFRLRE